MSLVRISFVGFVHVTACLSILGCTQHSYDRTPRTRSFVYDYDTRKEPKKPIHSTAAPTIQNRNARRSTDNSYRNTVPPVRVLASGPHADIFWPTSKLDKSDWIDTCVRGIKKHLSGDNFVTIQPQKHGQCVVGCNQAAEYIVVRCTTCNTRELQYCTDCFFGQMKTSELRCTNSTGCRKLLPYEIVERGNEKITTDAIETILTQATNNEAINNAVDQALRRHTTLQERYLSKSVDALYRAKAPNEKSFNTVTCPEVDCPFQALVEKQKVPVSCYFHPNQHICAQCSERWDHNHQCRSNKPFKSIEEHREKRAFPCPNCGILTSRNGACMHMTCTQCKHHWCWYCMYHFYGSDKESDKEKIKAYPDLDTYASRHRSQFHKDPTSLGNIRGTDYPVLERPSSRCPYRRYCELGPNCPCHRSTF